MIPPPLNPGDPLYAAWLNQLRDAVLAEIVGDGDVVVRRAGSRLTVGLARRIPGVQSPVRLAKITGLGTNPGEYTGTEVLPDGNAAPNALIWSGDTGNQPALKLLPGGCGPAISNVVRAHLGVDSNGNALWYFENAMPFWAIITGNAAFNDRFKYAWSEVRWNGDSTTSVSGGRSGTTSENYALNALETFHTSRYAWAVDKNGEPYASSTMKVMPAGGGGTDTTHRINVPVKMYEEVDSNGNLVYRFKAPGGHDGGCAAQ